MSQRDAEDELLRTGIAVPVKVANETLAPGPAAGEVVRDLQLSFEEKICFPAQCAYSGSQDESRQRMRM